MSPRLLAIGALLTTVAVPLWWWTLGESGDTMAVTESSTGPVRTKPPGSGASTHPPSTSQGHLGSGAVVLSEKPDSGPKATVVVARKPEPREDKSSFGPELDPGDEMASDQLPEQESVAVGAVLDPEAAPEDDPGQDEPAPARYGEIIDPDAPSDQDTDEPSGPPVKYGEYQDPDDTRWSPGRVEGALSVGEVIDPGS